jgi:AcrR family transcriptional regulator
MPRWEPNARERLAMAALELFAEQGYDNTTAAEIAERAGLAKSTFFRHFADKREALFLGQEALNDLLCGALGAAPAGAAPLAALDAALRTAGAVFVPQRRGLARKRQAIINAHADLRERELLKRAALIEALAGALRDRGVPEPAARLAAHLGDLALAAAYARWLGPEPGAGFGDLAHLALDELRSATAALG